MPAPHADEAFLFYPPPPARTASGNATARSWGPYSSAGDFGANMAIVLATLLCTVLLALSLGAAIRLLLNRRGRSLQEEAEKQQPQPQQQQEKSAPATLYSAAGTRLAGAESECTICLVEFEEGDPVSVLPACNHGFHFRCVERWLADRNSCPTCRSFCGVEAATAHGRNGDQVEVVVQGI